MNIRPGTADIQPTSLCNLNCTYCYVPGRRDARRMTRETLDAAVRFVLTSQVLDKRLLVLARR